MKPTKEYNGRSRIRMFNADCMEFMKECGKYDLAIVDPPYGIGFDNKIRSEKTKKWDSNIPSNKYFIELLKNTKEQIIWGGNYFPFLWNNGCRGFIFWHKDSNFDSYSDGELAWTSFNKPAKCFYWAWNGLADGIKGRNKKNKTLHPTQKPVQLYKWLLTNYAKEGDTILDTHGGSMSIAIACWDLGFDLDIIELDTDYFNDAVKRFENHIAQQQLF